jgi:hypothetical protein
MPVKLLAVTVFLVVSMAFMGIVFDAAEAVIGGY